MFEDALLWLCPTLDPACLCGEALVFVWNGALYCGDSCQAEEADTQQSMQFLDAAVKRVIW